MASLDFTAELKATGEKAQRRAQAHINTATALQGSVPLDPDTLRGKRVAPVPLRRTDLVYNEVVNPSNLRVTDDAVELVLPGRAAAIFASFQRTRTIFYFTAEDAAEFIDAVMAGSLGRRLEEIGAPQ